MEHLWSQAVATDGNPWQMAQEEKRLKQAKTVAIGCDQLPIGVHGKEGGQRFESVRGLRKSPAKQAFLFRQNLNDLRCPVGMEPFMERSGRQGCPCPTGDQ
jgi:hypothetical protein